MTVAILDFTSNSHNINDRVYMAAFAKPGLISLSLLFSPLSPSSSVPRDMRTRASQRVFMGLTLALLASIIKFNCQRAMTP